MPISRALAIVTEQISSVLRATFVANVVGGLGAQIVKPESPNRRFQRRIFEARFSFRVFELDREGPLVLMDHCIGSCARCCGVSPGKRQIVPAG